MARQIVEDHRVALAQRGDEDLLDVGKETLGVDRPVEHKGRNQPLAGEARKKRRFGAWPKARAPTSAQA
jgi:hypothetical protein